ncbi:unnamed protein product [Phytophthora lilii]|uniref:Unnamed protein product n=1 Tax=Phytophthora lilii TaxID=2077276 RepID=A0A9W7CRA9_9STRA|nr:unnamed protein product [Phytophthora lilii]
MLANGPEALNRYVASTFEPAIGSEMPQLEVRYKDLSITADITITEDVTAKSELPTLYNTVARSLARLSPKKRVMRKEIVKKASGVLKPGTITLVLGQPGSVKSALMKMLAGQFPIESNITVDGEITYNGVPQKEIAKRVPPIYRVRHAERPALRDDFRTVRTQIGNALVRGVPGGERKRVTTGEMEFGMKYVSLMDEISTGLDSAATYDIICTQRSIAKTLHKAVAISLLQPAPEVFALFDYVLIMIEGEVMYHGPREQVVPYFESLGFKCLPDRDIADYLLDLGTRMQHQYEVPLPVGMTKHPRAGNEFAQAFCQSRGRGSSL